VARTAGDRLFRLVKDTKEIEDTRDVFNISVEARSGGGMLSRLFGAPPPAPKAVENPMTAGELDMALADKMDLGNDHDVQDGEVLD
jgi:hypothetical protein